eukprot:scaffold2363_cov159-Amphora_coffeaeformis.AAC.52
MSFEAQDPNTSTAGVLPRALHALFDALEGQAADDPAAYSFTVTLQFLEVYGEDLRDLLAPRTALNSKLTVREYNDEPEVPGAVAEPCPTAVDATRAVERGSLRRVTAATAMNATSSRSHALLTVALEQRWEPDDDTAGATITKRSKFHFCDLAGSERQKRTQASGQRLKEGININQGLLVLGNVISALASNSSHVPYRESKLTRLLRGSLGGNHQTLMMACVSPAPENMDESLNCLRYANRAKNIQNAAIVNLDANSRRVLQLQQQIVGLAQTLLNVVTAPDAQAAIQQITFSRADLEALVSGGTAQVVGMDKMNAIASPSPVPRTPMPPTPPNLATAPFSQQTHYYTPREDYRLKEMEARVASLERELYQTHTTLKATQENHDIAELELHRYRAMERLGGFVALSTEWGDENKENTAAENFMEKATAYEQEISWLRKELQKAERKANRLALWKNVDPRDDEKRLADAEASLKHDQSRLDQLRFNGVLRDDSVSVPSGDSKLETSSPDVLDQEEQAEHEDLEKWTKKYLAQGGHSEDDDTEHLQEAVNEETEHSETPAEFKKLHLENDLVELTKSIEERENLIKELKDSQEKYATMREFYEEKLSQMESELKQKEDEREELIEQLKSAKTRGTTKDLQERLAEKDQNIATLREKQKELRHLTRVSHRNELDIARLQNDVTEMKRKRVDLQKQLASERKLHVAEVKMLQKTATQKEREINKLQKLSNQRELQAKKAGQVAKARLEELNALRAKNKETEKRLRMKSVKKGMMERAGLDSVLVGLRSRIGSKSSAKRSPKASEIDADALRSLFDEKISDVVRKEALADKLAEEWEEHYDLTTRKQELLALSDPDVDDDLQDLSIQIKYKQNRIRQLANKLSKQEQKGGIKADGNKTDYELFDEHFQKLSKDSSPEQAQKTLAKVLFGMVVRERRRISALARTASSLDDKLQQAEKAVEGSEAHLRAYMDEQNRVAAELSHSQQKSILSLMEMVKGGSKTSASQEGEEHGDSDDRKLLVLANERIALLESQITNLESECNQERDPPEDMVKLREAYDQACECRDSDLLASDDDASEDADWAAELMEDLAFIAEGKIPPSLQDLPGFAEQVAEVGNTPVEIENTDTTSVFDRLTNPDNFTGTQKRKAKRSKKVQGHASSQRSRQERNDQAVKTSIPETHTLPDSSTTPTHQTGQGGPEPTTSKKKYKSVFDRLISPSQATGVQRQKMARKNQSGEGSEPSNEAERSEDEFDRMLEDALGESGGALDDIEGGKMTQDSRSLSDSNILESPSSQDKRAMGRHYSDYAEQDVFERLSKTSTVSYQIRQGDPGRQGSITPENLLVEHHGRSSGSLHHHRDSHEELHNNHEDHQASYGRQNVFERLQKPTEAYAKKVHKPKSTDLEDNLS